MTVAPDSPAQQQLESEYVILSALVCEPHLFNGQVEVINPELFGDQLQQDVARIALEEIHHTNSCSLARVESALRAEGHHSDRALKAECLELANWRELLDVERVERALTVLLNGRTVTARLAELTTTDLGNARRLVVRHGSNLRCSKAMGWLAWDGKRWRRDETGEVERRAKHTVRCLYAEAAQVDDERKRKALAKWADASESAHRIDKMIKLAWSEPGIAITPDQLDQPRYLLNVNNGTIDLRTGKLKLHTPADLITKLAPVECDPEARCPTFEHFLDETTSGREDVATYLQQFLGMCLTGDVREQILPVWWGSGSNGKNTLIDPILAIMGDYAGKAAPDLLVAKKWSAHPTEIADLFGKRLVVASETEKGQRLRVQFVKEITGDATLKGRFMHKDFFEFRRTHKTILVTNNRPDVGEQTHAIWRRLQLVPFTNVVPDERQDKQLSEKLLAEAPGMLAWLVRGCLSWQREGLIVPGDVVAATSDYRAECDFMTQFAEESLTFLAVAWSSSARLAEAFDQWCRENAVEPNHRELKQLLRQHGCEPKTTRRGRGWSGVGIVTDHPEVPD